MYFKPLPIRRGMNSKVPAIYARVNWEVRHKMYIKTRFAVQNFLQQLHNIESKIRDRPVSQDVIQHQKHIKG